MVKKNKQTNKKTIKKKKIPCFKKKISDFIIL